MKYLIAFNKNNEVFLEEIIRTEMYLLIRNVNRFDSVVELKMHHFEYMHRMVLIGILMIMYYPRK